MNGVLKIIQSGIPFAFLKLAIAIETVYITEDFYYLLYGLTRTINNFRKASSNLAMVVNTCKSKVFERHMTKLAYRLINRQIPFFYIFQQFFQLFGFYVISPLI